MLSTLCARTGAQTTPYLVKDINRGIVSRPSDPMDFVTIGNVTFFTANVDALGRELWKTDGTEAGTTLVKKIGPIGRSSDPHNLRNVNGTLYFQAFDPATGDVLWRSDGTESGTVQVTAQNSPFVTVGHSTAEVNGITFFGAGDGTTSTLWRSDGTQHGTIPVTGGAAGPRNPGNLLNVGGVLLFFAEDAAHGRELWRSDGTDAGTMLVKDIRPGPEGSVSPDFGFESHTVAVAGNTLFFIADDGTGGCQLWKSDGTEGGTALVFNLNPPARFNCLGDMVGVGEELFFDTIDASHVLQLWKSDGTPDGTTLVKDIWPGPKHGGADELTSMGSYLVFIADDGTNADLWTSDGTGSQRLMAHAGTTSPTPSDLTRFRSLVFFSMGDLWATDGTPGGARLIKKIRSDGGQAHPDDLHDAGGLLLFSADDGIHGRELWKSDGTEAGTMLVKDINGTDGSSDPLDFTAVGGVLFFTADDPEHGRELWKSDATEAGTMLVKDIAPGPDSPFAFLQYRMPLYSLFAVGPTLYFTALDAALTRRDLWKSDGTEAGTAIVPGEFGWVSYAVDAGGQLFIMSWPTPGVFALWKSDGTDGGMVLLKQFPASSDGQPTNVSGKLFFDVREGSTYTLWKSDGTVEGTVAVQTFSATYFDFAAVGEHVFIVTAGNDFWRSDLWVSDGTTAGTLKIGALLSPFYLTAVGGRLFFLNRRQGNAPELWTSDGTAAGTVPLDVASILWVDNDARAMATVGETLFVASTDSIGPTLWKSDGTAGGTALVKRLPNGSTQPPMVFAADGMAFMVAGDGGSGLDLWRSDGTEMGTVRVAPLGAASWLDNDPSVAVAGSTLFYASDYPFTGRELWAVDLHDAAPLCVGDCDVSQSVTVNEILTGVSIALGNATITECSALDQDGSGTVSVDELITAVNNALNGCSY